MRGSIKTDLISCFVKYCGYSGSDGSFSIGSGHVNRVEIILGISHAAENISYDIQAQDNAISSKAVQSF
jgi:hypothetical protein